MTNQEAFNKVWQHFLVDGGKPSVNDENGECAYRADQTAECSQRCAMGVLIPDALYNQKFDQGHYSLHEIHELMPELNDVEYDLLRDMQKAHDHNADNDLPSFQYRFRLEMGEVAVTYNLTLPE